jgi:hypothetical protein
MVATASAIHSPANQERGRAAPRAAIDAPRSTGEIRSEPVENRKPSTGRAPMKKEPFTDRRHEDLHNTAKKTPVVRRSVISGKTAAPFYAGCHPT